MAITSSETTASADPWALLDLPRRAALTAEEIRTAFQKTAAACHPDNADEGAERTQRTTDFTAVNEAAAELTSVPRRLRRLLALEFPAQSAAAAPPPAMDDALLQLFSNTGAAVNSAAQLAAKKRQATTFLAKAALTAEEFRVQETLETASAAVSMEWETLQTRLEEIDAARKKTNPAAAEMLRLLAHRAAFLEKWQAQLQAAFAGMI